MDISKILNEHKLWLEGKGGSRANLIEANLRGADLRYADLRGVDLRGANLIGAVLIRADLRGANLIGADLIGADLRYANLIEANLRGADLRYADLIGADLSGANLSGANLDFACLPLWCGSLSANFDDRQLIQIAYHLVKAGINSNNASDETKNELKKLIEFANIFHRAGGCGRIEMEYVNEE